MDDGSYMLGRVLTPKETTETLKNFGTETTLRKIPPVALVSLHTRNRGQGRSQQQRDGMDREPCREIRWRAVREIRGHGCEGEGGCLCGDDRRWLQQTASEVIDMATTSEIIQWVAGFELNREPGDGDIPSETDLAGAYPGGVFPARCDLDTGPTCGSLVCSAKRRGGRSWPAERDSRR